MAINTTSREPAAYRHPQYEDARKRWVYVRDCVAGQDQVKSKKEKYLPLIIASDRSEENIARNVAYRERAIFVNVCDRTVRGLVGDVFSITPERIVPENLTKAIANITGAGMAIDDAAAYALSEIIQVGRFGILVDFPRLDAPATKADLNSGKVKPVAIFYTAEQIINWSTEIRDEVEVVTLVVLEEIYDSTTTGFNRVTNKQWRILRLNADGFYTQEIRREVDSTFTGKKKAGVIPPERTSDGTQSGTSFMAETLCKDASGKPMMEIPFRFVGSRFNTPNVDNAPLYDIAVINIGHYRNSADYEESVFLVGQPTLWVAGLTQTWVDKNFAEKKIQFGAMAPLVLPQGGSAGILQVKENTLAKEAMDDKMHTMVMMGARMVVEGSTEKTATESFQDVTSAMSVLAAAANNVTEAFTKMLQWMLGFVEVNPNLDEENVYYGLSTDFALSRMGADMRLQVMKEFLEGAITWDEYRTILKRCNVAYQRDDKAKAERDAQKAKEQDDLLKQASAKKQASANADPANPGGANQS